MNWKIRTKLIFRDMPNASVPATTAPHFPIGKKGPFYKMPSRRTASPQEH